jgi:hypothetical protein
MNVTLDIRLVSCRCKMVRQNCVLVPGSGGYDSETANATR